MQDFFKGWKKSKECIYNIYSLIWCWNDSDLYIDGSSNTKLSDINFYCKQPSSFIWFLY